MSGRQIDDLLSMHIHEGRRTYRQPAVALFDHVIKQGGKVLGPNRTKAMKL